MATACGGEPVRPSILLITLDTLRADHVGAYGSAAGLTPQLDALAREGLVHESAFTTMPTTGPAHISLFTGLLPSRHGAVRNGVRMDVRHRERELALRLQQAGYATAAFVTSKVLAPKAVGLEGFEVYQAPAGFLQPGRAAARAALDWLDGAREPVFLWLHLYDPHSPYGPAEQKPRALPLRPGDYGWVGAQRYADPAALQRMRDAYAAGVRDADAALGQLVSGARERLSTAPFVIAVSDHGEALDEHLAGRGYAWDHGEFLDPEQIRIALVLAGPGVRAGRSPAPVSIRDLYTTLLAAAGLDDPGAAAEGRRDLRAASASERRVAVERQVFENVAAVVPRAADAAAVRAHAVAVADSSGLAIVGEDGAPAPASASAGGELIDAARGALHAARDGAASGQLVDPDVAEALRSLGYAQ